LKNSKRQVIFILVLACLGCACNHQKILNKRVTLWRMDPIPYGTKYAFDNLPMIFPDADIRTSRNIPQLLQNVSSDDTLRTLMVVSGRFDADSDEMNALIRFASFGNQVFISCQELGDSVSGMLHLKWTVSFDPFKDSAQCSILNPASGQYDEFGYPGYGMDSYFEAIDTGFAEVLGKNSEGKPDFIRIPFPQGGAIYLHLNPFAFTNFFLLHRENKSYYDLALSNLPAKSKVVEWSEYFRYSKNGNFSAFHFIKSNRSLRWAFWLTLVLFGILFLVDSKRKQRPITEIPALQNASVDFVKTVGRLYFQQKNNQNLAIKMITAFLENVRSAYNLSTSMLNDEFIQKLAFRTGIPINQIQHLVYTIHEIRMNPHVSDPEIMDLHQQINQFNKQD
jgi:hypothetical protein